MREVGVVPVEKVAGPSKGGPEDQRDRENVRRTPPPAEPDQMDDVPIPLDLHREKVEKRAPTDVEDLITSHLDSVTVEVEDVWMSRLDSEEKKTTHVKTEDLYAKHADDSDRGDA